jgi:hypothetical protein
MHSSISCISLIVGVLSVTASGSQFIADCNGTSSRGMAVSCFVLEILMLVVYVYGAIPGKSEIKSFENTVLSVQF